jgi:CheY-like chemotaxis protein
MFVLRIAPSTGAEVLTHLKSIRATALIPVIALTGQPSPGGDELQGLDGWIEKPFDIDVLLEHIGRLAERQG